MSDLLYIGTWRCVVAWIKKFSKVLWKTEVAAHWSSKHYKTITKEFWSHQFTVRQIVYKWKQLNTIIALPWNGQPTSITSKAICVMLWEVLKNSRITSKELKPFLHWWMSLFMRILNSSDVYDGAARRPTLKKEHYCPSTICKRSDGSIGKILKVCSMNGWVQNTTF